MPAACWLLKNSLKRAVKRNVLLVCDIWVVLIGGGLGGCWDFQSAFHALKPMFFASRLIDVVVAYHHQIVVSGFTEGEVCGFFTDLALGFDFNFGCGQFFERCHWAEISCHVVLIESGRNHMDVVHHDFANDFDYVRAHELHFVYVNFFGCFGDQRIDFFGF